MLVTDRRRVDCGQATLGDSPRTSHRRGFTLIELLMTIGLIGLLVGLSVPAVGAVRTRMRKAQCMANMREIGVLFQMYFDQPRNLGKLPKACQMPSINPRKLPPIYAFLDQAYRAEKTTTKNAKGEDETKTVHYTNLQKLFHCPADEDYYPVEGLSYEYFMASRGGQTITDVLTSRSGTKRDPATISVLSEFGPFHGSGLDFEDNEFNESTPNRHYLYLDWHVDDGSFEERTRSLDGASGTSTKESSSGNGSNSGGGTSGTTTAPGTTAS